MKIIQTLDGSSTICSPHFNNELYHSSAGAIAEAMHVYIRFLKPNQSVLEIGFGSGLNALLALQTNLKLNYTSFELYPIDLETAQQLSFCSPQLLALHQAPWNETTQITQNFNLKKININIEDTKLFEENLTNQYDLVFFDAFAPDVVPQQWSEDIFKIIYSHMNQGGELVTYSAKGIVKEALRAAGFTVKREKGALGKHHMVVATK